jgi:dienelactone hydrolase
VKASVGFDSLRAAGDALYWLESRPEQGGTALVRWQRGHDPADVTPGFSVGNGVHAYGGGAYAVTADGVWCAGERGIYRVDGRVQPVVADGSHAYGDLVAGGGELLCVRETQTGDALVAIPMSVGATPRVLAEAPGFFGAPRPGPGLLAWLWWSAREMPWDACELWVAAYEPGGLIGDPVKVAGGMGESVVEPQWGPGGALYFMSDRSGWWNLHRWDGVAVEAVAPIAAECAAEPWELGYASYAFLADGRVAMAVQDGPRHCLAIVDHSGAIDRVALPYTSIKPYLAVHGSAVALIGASPTAAPQVALVHLDSDEPTVEVLARAEHADLDGVAVSTPIELAVPVDEGRQVMALLYPPTGAAAGWRAPLIVRVHPGPTASSLLRLDWQVQFFTSRGFALVDVDYTGSTGYGRAFRQALYGRWGIDDVADCRAVAEHLLADGRAIPGQVFIRGASAGGYTALHAVADEGPFVAATAVSAITDPDRWRATVPRFQRPHAARLRGGAGEVRAAAIRRPVLLVHGTDDEVAAASDVLRLVDELRQRDVPHEVLLLEGVGHDVAASGDAGVALEAELQLYQRVIGAPVAAGR